jgi:four helix bundle protein
VKRGVQRMICLGGLWRIQERLTDFAVRLVELCDGLPKTFAGRYEADQLMRSATAAAPNYAEACSGESLRDFVHKLGIVRKELNESYVWLRMLGESRTVEREILAPC